MKTKEQWIDETLESLDGIRRAGSDPMTYEKVMHRLRAPMTRRIQVQPGLVWRVAAGLTLLIGLNALSLFYFSRSSRESETQTKTLATEYFSYTNSIKL
jgi:hypothetical protein